MQFVMLVLQQITTLACQIIFCGGATVRFHVRPLFILLATLLVLVACTRERPTPEPTATPAVQSSGPTTVVATPENITNTAPVTTSVETGIAVTVTPSSLTPAPNGTPTAATPATFPYVVKDGDTLGSIASQFATDVDTLRSLNKLSSDNISVGQPLEVPYQEGITPDGVAPPTPGPFLYTIEVGDTLSALAERFNVDTIAIIEANTSSLFDPDNLTIGSTILIPGYQPPSPTEAGSPEEESAAEDEVTSYVHVVQSGQGLIGISLLYGVSVDEIAAANGLTTQDILRIGQELIIPGVTERDIAIAQGHVHVVQLGETLLSIALDYYVTTQELEEANDLDNPDSIFVGQELIIPPPQ